MTEEEREKLINDMEIAILKEGVGTILHSSQLSRMARAALAVAEEAISKDSRARIAELEAKIKRLSNKNIISTDVRRERIYNAISAWTNASDTVCSCATEAIVRIVNDHFGG